VSDGAATTRSANVPLQARSTFAITRTAARRLRFSGRLLGDPSGFPDRKRVNIQVAGRSGWGNLTTVYARPNGRWSATRALALAGR
jgi:hypothetical protein